MMPFACFSRILRLVPTGGNSSAYTRISLQAEGHKICDNSKQTLFSPPGGVFYTMKKNKKNYTTATVQLLPSEARILTPRVGIGKRISFHVSDAVARPAECRIYIFQLPRIFSFFVHRYLCSTVAVVVFFFLFFFISPSSALQPYNLASTRTQSLTRWREHLISSSKT